MASGRWFQIRGGSKVDVTPKLMGSGSGNSSKLIGSFILWGGEELPSYCKVAVGDTYPIDDYPDAAMILGTTFGGDGVDTFGTPDLRSASPVEGLRWLVVLGIDQTSIIRLYAGREGIYCGLEGLHCGKLITD